MAHSRNLSLAASRAIFPGPRSWLCIVVLLSAARFDGRPAVAAGPSLSDVSQLVKKNEELIGTIKLDYEIEYSRTGELQVRSDSRHEPRPYSKGKGTWAQDGIRQHSSMDHFYGVNEPAKGYKRIIDGEVSKWARKPDLMDGGIGRIADFEWNISPLLLGIRPFERSHYLSDFLVPMHAVLHERAETINGREAFVVTGKLPWREVPEFARAYIDCQRGTLLRLEFYAYHPDRPNAILFAKLEVTNTQRLGNGAWVPIEGVRELYFRDPDRSVLTSRIRIDPKSITTDRKDIPDSLFTIQFPPGATVSNSITGITSKAGRGLDLTVEAIIEDSIKTLDKRDTQTKARPSERTKQQARAEDQQQELDHQAPNQQSIPPDDTADLLADVRLGGTRPGWLLWILLWAFLASLAITLVILILRAQPGLIRRSDVR